MHKFGCGRVLRSVQYGEIQLNLSICLGSGRLFCMHLERYAVTEVFTV